MNESRRRILIRGAKGLAAAFVVQLGYAISSKEFRDFVGDDWWAPIAFSAAAAVVLAAEKAVREWKRNR